MDKDIKQITQSQFDERFYTKKGLINSSSNNEFFPSVTHILERLPTPPQLVDWYKNKGHESTRIFNEAAKKGTFVHNTLEQLVLNGELDLQNLQFQLDLESACPCPKDQAFVMRCFSGFNDWVNDMLKLHDDFEILETETAIFGADYAGTIDLIVRMSGKTYLVDFKTSSAINEKHEIQVEAYRRAKGVDTAAVLRLGSARANCKNYQFKPISTNPKKEKLWNIFHHAKSLFYLTKNIQPTSESIPKNIKLNDSIRKNIIGGGASEEAGAKNRLPVSPKPMGGKINKKREKDIRKNPSFLQNQPEANFLTKKRAEEILKSNEKTVQVLNPETNRYIKINPKKGNIISIKKSEGAYKGVIIL